MPTPSVPPSRELTVDELQALFAQAEARGLVRQARKTKPVDARPAVQGEVVMTTIAGEGIETRSRAAEPGDWVVRNRCAATGNEEYLVAAEAFRERYEAAGQGPGADGWREYRPLGKTVRFFEIQPEHGAFTFTAPWGERMIAKPGDAIVQDPEKPADTYRVAAASFACTYEVTD